MKKGEFNDWKPLYRNIWSRDESAKYMLWNGGKQADAAGVLEKVQAGGHFPEIIGQKAILLRELLFVKRIKRKGIKVVIHGCLLALSNRWQTRSGAWYGSFHSCPSDEGGNGRPRKE